MGGTCSTRSRVSVYEVQEYNPTFKVLVIGALETGKTAIVQRHLQNRFKDEYQPTSGAEFAQKVIEMKDGRSGRLQFWDIGGNKTSSNMNSIYYREAVGCIVVFDVSQASTFDAVAKLKVDLDNKMRLPNGQRIPCILIANKCDLTKDGPVNNTEKMDCYCQEKGFDKWFETSAKENTNIDKAIEYLTDQIRMIEHTLPKRVYQGGARK